MDSILGKELVLQDLSIVDTAIYLKNTKIICLYFSASYCPPCVKFTPILSSIYKELKKRNKEIEIIFISSDKTIESSNRYFNYMPWVTIPYEKRYIKERLCNIFDVQTIPQLIILNNDGDIVDNSGRFFMQTNKDDIDNIIQTLNL